MTHCKADNLASITELELNGTRISNSAKSQMALINFSQKLDPNCPGWDIEEVGSSFNEFVIPTNIIIFF